MRAGPVACAALALAAGLGLGGPRAAAGGDDPLVEAGRQLYLEGCSSCHGAEGAGAVTEDGELRGPSLLASGEAAAYFQLATGRMPLANSEEQPQRKEPAYDDDEIAALVAFVGSLGDGPPLPVLPAGPADLVRGNELFRDNCQACHSASGSGGALSYGRAAPPTGPAHGLEIAAAIRAGPGQMPVFGPDILSDDEVGDVVAYVEYLDDPADPGGLPIGRLGPIPEGFVAWFVGMTALLGIVSWIGTHARGRRGRAAVTAEVRAIACFLVAGAAAIGLAVVYIAGGQTQLEGILLALTSGGIGVGIVVWAKAYMPGGEVTEERGPLESTPEELEAFTAAFQAGERALTRRRVLLASAGAAFAALGAAVVFPILSLGPSIRSALRRTPYADAPRRLVQEDGEPIRVDELPVDSVLTAFPEGHTDAADAPTLVIRTRPTRPFHARPGRDDWTVDGVVAYSKLCTHVGCPVGLYQAEVGLLLCPCHQSTFDVYDGARPIFGPAARSLPQLPLSVDDAGYLIATADFSGPVGPGFWDRDR